MFAYHDRALTSPSQTSCYLITHAHLDHINSLVVSAGSFLQGPKGPRKRVYGVKQTLDDISSLLNDRIWPNLGSWNQADDNFKLLYSPYAPIRLFTPTSHLPRPMTLSDWSLTALPSRESSTKSRFRRFPLTTAQTSMAYTLPLPTPFATTSPTPNSSSLAMSNPIRSHPTRP